MSKNVDQPAPPAPATGARVNVATPAAPPDDLDERIARAVANQMMRMAPPAAPPASAGAGAARVFLLAEKQAQYGGVIFVNVGNYPSVSRAWEDAVVIEGRDGCTCHVALFLPRGIPQGVALPVLDEGDLRLRTIDVG